MAVEVDLYEGSTSPWEPPPWARVDLHGHGGRPPYGSVQLVLHFCLQNGDFNYIFSKNQKLNKMRKLTSIFNNKVEVIEVRRAWRLVERGRVAGLSEKEKRSSKESEEKGDQNFFLLNLLCFTSLFFFLMLGKVILVNE